MKIQNIEKRMEGRGDGKVKEELMKLASETPEEEAQMMLDMEILQLFKEWKEKNKGGFDEAYQIAQDFKASKDALMKEAKQ